MAKKLSILLTGLITLSTLGAFTLLLTAPSWSSPARLFVNGSAPESLMETSLTLRGGGFSPATSLWLAPERSIRSATTATLETYGNPHHFIHRDDHLYVANGVGGFFVVQGLQSPAPFINGILNSDGQGLEIALHRDEALLAAGTSGLQIIDIRDDANPRLLAALKSVAPALSVASSGKIAYVASGKAGVKIVDLTDPRHPRYLGELPDIPEAYKLSCDDKMLIIATATGGWLYDISQSEQPRRLAALPVPGGSNTVMTRRGEILYWAIKGLQESRLYSLDLSRPESPSVLSSVPLNGVPHGINCSEDQLAIALGTSGTQIISLSTGTQLKTGTTVMAKSRTRHSLLLGNDLWVADGSGELLRLNQQKSEELYNPPILTNISPRIQPVVTPQLFILGDDSALTIHARWDDTALILLARLPITGLMQQQYLSADQRQLWLAVRNVKPLAGGKLLGIDISTPYAPRITAEIPFSTTPVIVGERGTTLVIATAAPEKLSLSGNPLISITYSDFLHFIDISLPEAPSEFLNYSLGNSCAGITLVGNALALMQIDGLFRLIDLSEKHAPKELGSLQMPWLQTAAWSSGIIQIAVKDKVAFISSPLGIIASIDLNNPRQPKNLGSFSLDGPISSLLTNDNLLLVDVKKKGVVFIDLKNPRTPVLLGSIPLPGYLQKGTIQDGLFWYVVSESKGLWSFPLPRRLQSSVADDDQIVASLTQQPPAGAYRFWLTDAQTSLLVPGVSWSPQ